MRLLCSVFTLLFIASLQQDARASVTPEQTRKSAAEIDALLAVHWKSAKVVANDPISDETFLRRIYLDLAGRIPTAVEAHSFLEATQPDKRATLIHQLLSSESYVSNFYNFWADILRFKSTYVNRAGVVEAAYEKYIKESLRSNKPYDQFVREMLSAKGYVWENNAVGYYLRDPEMPLDNMAITSRIFLGTRIECAQCHDHPFDKWKQTEFYHLAAYTYGNKPVNEAFGSSRDAIRARQDAITEDFKKEKAISTDGGKEAEKRKQARLDAMEYRKIVGIIKGPVGQLFSPIGIERKSEAVLKLPFDFHQDDGKPGDIMKPQPIFGKAEEINAGSDAAEVFARWVTASDNQHFNTVIVNRLWKKMFGIALLDQFDDMTDKSQSALPELEAHLEKLIVSLHYDMRAFLAIIASTRAYQSAVMHDEVAQGDAFHFQAAVLRRMTAEQVWDSIVALASYEPDARDLKRELRNERRIGVSQMACDAYLNFDGTKLLDMAYARLQAELDLEKRDKAVKEELIVAKRNGDKAREIDLRHQEGAIDRERGETYVEDFIMPILTNLANTKVGPEAKIVEDELYKMNANPRVMQTETWKRLYVTGYGPAPKTAAQVAAEAEAEKQKLIALARKIGVPEKEQADFMSYCGRGKTEWLRASELDSPAPRGHFLRTMGQSDRDFVENANPNASIPQALALMNGELISRACLLSPYSPLMISIQQCTTPEAKVEAAYLSLLSRKPTAQEKLIWSKSATSNDSIDHLIYALLNTKQFMFIQ